VVQPEPVQTTEPRAINTSSIQQMVFSTHTGLLLGEVISMRYNGGCIVSGAFAIARHVKVSQETGWGEGDRSRIFKTCTWASCPDVAQKAERDTRADARMCCPACEGGGEEGITVITNGGGVVFVIGRGEDIIWKQQAH
jgi:hypothetical protein